MTDYLNALKANGVDTLKNFVIDTVLNSVANWGGDRFVDSITTITTSSPFAGGVMSFATNGADLLGKVVSTRYSNNDYLGSALRVAVTGGSIVGAVLLTPSLAGRVGIEISKEVMLRYGVSALLVQLLRRTVVPFIMEKVITTEKNIDYKSLTVDQVNDKAKFSDALIVKMAAHIALDPLPANVVGMSKEVGQAIHARATAIQAKVTAEKNVETTKAAAVEARKVADAKKAEVAKSTATLGELERTKDADAQAVNGLAADATDAVKNPVLEKAAASLKAFTDAETALKALDADEKKLEAAAVAAEETATKAKAVYDQAYPVVPPAK